jgi:hypothetical protein
LGVGAVALFWGLVEVVDTGNVGVLALLAIGTVIVHFGGKQIVLSE